MRRAPALLLLLGLAMAAPAAAQTRVSLVVRLEIGRAHV